MKALALVVAALTLVVAGGCGSSSPRAVTEVRPTTAAKLLILSPTANQVTGPAVTVLIDVIGGTVLAPTAAAYPLRGDQGHIHLSVDGKLVSMAYTTHAQVQNLPPGTHTLSAEWVASDHLPFANRVVAAVIFTVRG